jgi:hypothetical protein
MHAVQSGVYNGDEGARTPDLDSAIVALFQLSYIPLTQEIISYRCDSVKGVIQQCYGSVILSGVKSSVIMSV